jgi:hypothetical protein
MESKSSSLPTFIVIGAMKSGTSSLHNYLSMHPEIGMSLKKELDFFKSKIFISNGLDWYKNQFSDQYPFRGESSPNYTKYHDDSGIAERMHKTLPNIKLIYLVRNPLERIVSHYVHNYSNGGESRALHEVIENKVNNKYLETGLYMFQLKQFLKYYERDQILLIKSDDLKTKRAQTLSDIFLFLGARPDYHDIRFEDVFHKSINKTRQRSFVRDLKKIPYLLRIISKITPQKIFQRFTKKQVETPVLSPHEKESLIKYYEDDINELEHFTKWDLSDWRNPLLPLPEQLSNRSCRFARI